VSNGLLIGLLSHQFPTGYDIEQRVKFNWDVDERWPEVLTLCSDLRDRLKFNWQFISRKMP